MRRRAWQVATETLLVAADVHDAEIEIGAKVWGRRERKMTGQTPYLTRYLVRMGSNGWMVWDRHARAPARLEGGRPVIELTEEQAREISDELNKNNIADG